MSANFVHLHCHSEYSLLDGLSKIKRLVKHAKELDMPAIALTDHGVMYGAIDFYKECKKQDLKPLIGMEGYVTNRSHKLREGKSESNHILLLAKNYTGYKNLMKLSSIAHLEGFYYRPRFDKATLRKYAEGLICTSACLASEVAEALVAGNYDSAKQIVADHVDIFGQENYFLEIQRHFYRDYFDAVKSQPKILDNLQRVQKQEDIWVTGIVKLSRELGVPLVCTNDAHYVRKADATAQDALVCISTGKNVSDIDRMRYIDAPTFYIRSPEEMSQIFPDYPDALANTVKLADSVDVTIELGKWYFPKFEIPGGKTAPDYLTEMAWDRFPAKYPDADQATRDRLTYELDVIVTKGYAPYFLMMADMVNWCTDHGIITNTRGSAAGSITTYVIGITTVDPIKFGLPFERFLNPLRPSAPDIDLDIADDRREELIAYIVSKYGQEKVAQICTFGRMMAKAAVRDISRVLGHPYSFGDRLAKVIPLGSQGFPMTIDKALETSPELKVLYDSDPAAKQAVDLAKQIEGNARHTSVHAAGTVVSPTDMTDYTPLQLEPSGTKVITQYEFHTCEEVGLVKFDILGIRNLSILGAARDIVQRERNIKVDFTKIPVDDKKTFAMLARGDTMGAFQLGGSGMTKWLKELKPTRIEDIAVMIALFRPGPMANIPEFIARKNKKVPTTYPHPKMSSFLDKSYGILVYQDDLLFTALELAGYNWESVDKFRKAVGKKIPEEMAKQHEIFVEGCQKTSGMTREEAEKIWDLFVPFQGYGFNKAHAASYAMVSYQTAYMKANYPVEYMTALLTAEAGDTEKIVEAIDECRRMKIPILPPDVIASQTGFTIEEGSAIRFGFSAIKNVGGVAIDVILEARTSGPFTSFTDFCLRVDSQKVNRKVLESLIKAGAMDRFGARAAMLAALDKIRELGTSISKLKSSGQTSLFGGGDQQVDTTDNLPDISEFEKGQKLQMEKELLGFFLTEHPHSDKLTQLTQHISHRIADLLTDPPIGERVTIGGIVESVRNVITKNGNQPMCFARVSDLGKSVEVVVFPKVYATTPTIWQPDNIVLLAGKVESRDSGTGSEDSVPEVTILADTAATFIGQDTVLPTPQSNGYNSKFSASKPSAQEPTEPLPTLTITIPKGTSPATLVTLNSLLQNHKGTRPTSLFFENNGSSKTIPLPFSLNWTPELATQVTGLLRSN